MVPVVNLNLSTTTFLMASVKDLTAMLDMGLDVYRHYIADNVPLVVGYIESGTY